MTSNIFHLNKMQNLIPTENLSLKEMNPAIFLKFASLAYFHIHPYFTNVWSVFKIITSKIESKIPGCISDSRGILVTMYKNKGDMEQRPHNDKIFIYFIATISPRKAGQSRVRKTSRSHGHWLEEGPSKTIETARTQQSHA